MIGTLQQHQQHPPAPAPDAARVVTVTRVYYFAPGHAYFYSPTQEAQPAAGVTLEEAGTVSSYPIHYLQAFVHGEADSLPIEVQRVIVYEWLRSAGK